MGSKGQIPLIIVDQQTFEAYEAVWQQAAYKNMDAESRKGEWLFGNHYRI